MLSRRHIRIKVLQSLYSWEQQERRDIVQAEKQLLQSLDRIQELYLLELRLILEVKRMAEDYIELARNKRLPTEADLNPNLKFVNNRFFLFLEENVEFNRMVETRKISWAEEKELIRKIYLELKESNLYKEYMESPEDSAEEDRRFIKKFYLQFIASREFLHQWYEDQSIYWADDLDAAQMMVMKTVKRFNAESGPASPLIPLYKDAEDRDFGPALLRKCLAHREELEKLVIGKARNWDAERIAQLDLLLMIMALCEFIYFESVPVKVTMNEYIELSKDYSTPRSSVFINGILDKSLEVLKAEDRIKKVGRGLLES